MAKDSKYDLIVVGTGFASSFFLKKFLEKPTNSKKSVLVLERGMLFPHSDRVNKMRGKVLDYESDLKNCKDLFINENKSKSWIFDVNFGGSSNCWWGCTPRFMPNDFKLKTLYGQASDWPISYEDLEPYYCETEEIMAISGPENTPFYKSKKYPLPPHTLSTIDKVMQKKYGEKMYLSQPSARASTQIGSRNACCSSYTCNVCPINAKFTVENTLSGIYNDPRVEIQFNSQVIRLILENNLAKGVQVKTGTVTSEIAAEMIALGANAIFNAHILLNSGDTSELLGKGLTEQAGVFANIYLDNFMNVGGSSSLTAHGYMLYDGEFRKNHASCLIESHNAPIIRNERGKWRNIARMKFVFEDLPDNTNQITLSDNEEKPLVNFKAHSSYVDKAFENLKSTIGDVFSCLPVEKIALDDFYQDTEFHSLCSVRMSKKPQDGVVDENMVHHRYRNLLVLGGSAFPTAAAANPTLTISALSLRAADKLF